MSGSLSFIPPQLPTLVDTPPIGEAWQHEIKYDGYRTQIIIDGSDLRAFTKRGHDWSSKYQPILKAAAGLGHDRAILDGEMIVQDESGRSDFYAFQTALHREPHRLVFMAFDLLNLGGTDLRTTPLQERRQRLQEIIGSHQPTSCIQFSDHHLGNGQGLFEAADHMGLEGIVSKKRSSQYRSGPSRSWLKIKCFEISEFLVIGIDRSTSPATALLAQEEGLNLVFAGGAMITLTNDQRDAFWAKARLLQSERPPLPMPKIPVEWLRPGLRVRAKYLKGSKRLRHATLAGIVSP